MRRLKVFLLVLLVSISCTACKGNITRDIRHAGFSIGGNLKCDMFFNKKNPIKLKYLIGSTVITEDGNIYELTFDKIYKSGQQCRKADTDLRVKAIMDGSIIKASDDKLYYLLPSEKNPAYSMVSNDDKNLSTYYILLKDADIVKVSSGGDNLYYVLKSDGNVYQYSVSSDNPEKTPVIASISIMYDKKDFGGDIIDFNYSGDYSLSTYIRTANKLHRVKNTNSKECNKYADVVCEFKMGIDEMYEKRKDSIAVFNGSSLITTYSKQFTIN